MLKKSGRSREELKKNPDSPTEERYRTSRLVIEVTSFGTAMQHTKTLSSIRSELELRGYDINIVSE